jgi:transposase-like protein
MKSWYAPCPYCGSTNAREIGFMLGGGVRLPDQVKCRDCGTEYDGTTGTYITSKIRAREIRGWVLRLYSVFFFSSYN